MIKGLTFEADSKNKELKTKFPRNVKWNDENELILKSWADKGVCFKTMHDRSAKKYWCLNAWFSIPVIIISTLAGSGNFAQGSFKKSYSEMLVLLIASSNIFCAILSTISQYIGVAGLYESHRVAALSWDKYSRSIQVELAKNRSERRDAQTFVSKAEEDYNRLMEISPHFGNDIISWFNHLIDTGEFDESNKYICGPCCYQWFCFPCGCKGVYNPKCKKYKCCGSDCWRCVIDNNESDYGSESEDSELQSDVTGSNQNEIYLNNTDNNKEVQTKRKKKFKNDKEKIDYYMKKKKFDKVWQHLEVPDIVGRMRPTLIADPTNDPLSIVEDNKEIQTVEDNVVRNAERPEDKYRILNEDDIV
tara:strand:- start:1839 stop:2921 length:1083 start_codon:yes stop_codon:yes gene_type:complete